MKDLHDPKKAHLFPWIENQGLTKSNGLEGLPIDNEVKKWFEGYFRDKNEEIEERLKGW